MKCTQLLVVLFVMTLLGHPVYADATLDASKAIKAAYKRQGDAMAKGDVKGVMPIETPDYTSIDENGQETARSIEEQRQHWVEALTPPSHVQDSVKVLSVKLQDGGAVVTENEHSSITYFSKKTNGMRHITMDSTNRNFWIKSQSRWLLKRSRTLSMSAAP